MATEQTDALDDATLAELTELLLRKDRDVLALADRTRDVAVYEAPPLPGDLEDDALVDTEGTRWEIARDALVSGDARRERIAGRHGLWFAFRSQYDEATVVEG